MKKYIGSIDLMTSRFILAMLILCIAMVLQPFSAFAAEETEPNGKLGIANAVTAGEANTGSFTPAGDNDWFKVALQTPGRLVCSITSPPENIRSYITLYNRHADYMYVTSYAVNDGDDVHFTYDVTEPGTYYIRVHDRDNDSSEETYTFTADFTPVVDTREPNNQLGAASLITGTSLTGIIFDRNNEDWFKIYADANDTLSFTVAPPAEMRPNITVYGPHANYLYVSKQSVNLGDMLILEHTVSESGFYYIRLTDAQNLAHTETYTLSVSGGNPGFVPSKTFITIEQENNDQFGIANFVAIDTSVSGAIGDADDGDWYQLELPQAGQLTVALTSVPGNLELRFRLYNSSGGQLLSGQSTDPGELFSLIYDVTTPDTYYLFVDDLDNAAYSAEDYTFSTSLVEVADPFEPNDNYGDARVLDQLNRIEGFIFKTGDHDWFRISVDQAGSLRVILSDLPENISPAVDIYNMSKEHLAGKSGTAGMNMELVCSVQAAGEYLIRVRDSGDNDESTESCTLTIHGANFDAFAPTASIDRIVPGSIIVGDSIQFTGSGFDSDGDIAGYDWRSGIDGHLSSEAIFSTGVLSMGTHTIYFKVRDNDGIWSTEVSEVVYVGSSVSDEVEANSPIGLANEIAISQPVSAKINAAGDQDFFKVYISRPGRLTCSVTNVPNNLRLYFTYYSRHLNYLYITGYAEQDGDDVSLTIDITEPGFIYLQIHDRDNEFNTAFTYTLTTAFKEAVDPQDANNSMLDAFTLTENTIAGYIFPNGDHDWFKVWVNAGSTLTAQITNTASNLRPYISFYGRNREYLYCTSYAENEGDNPPVLNYTFDEAGFVYIRVHDRDNDYNWNQMYALTVTGADPGYVPPESPVTAEVENNGVIADANLITLNAQVSGFMGEADDNDWFKFEIPSAGIIRTCLDPVPVTMRGRIRIYRADYSQIDGRDATNPGDLLVLDTTVICPGFYMVRIEDLNRNTPQEAYSLAVVFTSVSDIHEPNGNIGDASLLKDRNRIHAMIFDQGDEDWYQVTCDAGNTLQITVADVPDEIRPQIEVYNNSGSWLAGKTATNNGQELILSYDVDTAAGYFIRVRHAGNNSFSTQTYTLIVNGARFSSYTPLAVIDSVTPNPADAGETVTLEGHGEDADGEIIGYTWRSSLDGILSTSRVATPDNLSTGTHTLYFKVKDSDQNWSPETSTILYFGVPAPQEEEPNGEIGNATPMELDTQYTGVMDASGDHDYFRISIEQPGMLTISATNPSGSLMRTYLTMYTIDADYAYATSSAANAGDPVTLTWNIVEPGDYFFRVHDNNNNAEVQYTITASLQMSPDPYEPNHDITSATSLKIGDMFQGYIFPNSDEDWYKVILNDQGTLSVSLTNMPENLRGYITIYDSNTNYTYVTAYANNDKDNVYLDYNVAMPGTYFIRIHDRDNDSNPAATYTLKTDFLAAPDSFEPNSDIWHSTALTKSPINAYIFPGGDQDWYRFYAQSGSELVMTVDEVPENLRPYLMLYNANTEYMYKYATTDVEGSPVILTYTVEDTGYYYLRVHDRDSDWSAAGTYRLSVTGADLSYIPPDQPATVEAEPNNEFRYATFIGTGVITGTFGGNEDWYRFEVTKTSRLTLSLTVPSTVRSVIRLYNANYSERASRYAENTGDFSWVTFDIDEPGTWYVRIYADGGVSSAESYELNVALDSALDPFEPNPDYASAVPLTFGAAIQAAIFPVADQDWFRMEVGESGMIRFELGDVPVEIEISMVVYNQNNSQVFYKEALNSGESLEAIFVAADPGIYYVKIYDRGNNDESISSYSLTASLTPFEDAFEPNDRYSEAIRLNEKNQISGLIYPEGDYDWYVLTVGQAGTLKIRMTETEGIEPRIELYNDSKSHLSTMSAKNAGDDLVFTYEITKPDFYYLRIRDDGDNNRSLSPYVLTIQGAVNSEYYPVSEISTLNPNPVITGDMVILTGIGTDEDGTVMFYEWASDLDGILGTSEVLTISSLSKGAHRITFKVQDNDGHWSGRVHKTIYVTDQILAEAEFNNDIAHSNPVPLSTWITGRIFPKYDEDYYKIYVEERGYLSTLVDAVPQAMRAYITFYDANGNYMYSTDSAQNDGEWFSYNQFIETGWYYVKVHDRDSEAHESTYGLLFNFVPAKDIHEPNDSLGEATLISPDSTIPDARICRQGDEDWYRMEVAGKGRLSLSITEASLQMRGYITIYNDNADYIYVTNYAYHDGEDVFLDYDINSPGTYYVKVHERDNEAHIKPYTFTSQFMPVEDVYEYNDNAGNATLMPQAGVDAVIFPSGDKDWYKVYATQDEVLSLSVTQTPQDMKANIAIYGRDINYTYISNTANNDGDNVFLNYSVPANGFYYIRITDSSNRSHLTPYQFTVEGGTLNYEPLFAPVTTEVEPNGSFGEANDVALDTPAQPAPVTGSIDPDNDYDWYRFYVNAPGILTISHTDIPNEVRSEMWVYNSNYNQIGDRITTNPGEDNILVMTVNEAGYYRVRLRDYTGTGSASAYTLKVTQAVVVDGNEPNNDFGMATPLSEGTIQGYLFDKDDNDWYRVYVRDPGVISVSLNVVPEELRPRLRLYNNNKTEKASYVNTNPGVGEEDAITYDVPESGFYFVRVYDEDDGYSANPYTLSITGADFSTAPLLSSIGNRGIDEAIEYAFTVDATDPDNEDELTFSASSFPPGASFDPGTRTFRWTPAYGQAGTYSGIHFEVSDGVYSDSEDITITVNRVSRTPVLSPIGNKTVQADNLMSFQISATDPDIGDALIYSAMNLPSGASFDSETRTFAWTPLVESQEGLHEDIYFQVTDGVRTDFEYININVIGVSLPSVITGIISAITQTEATVAGEITATGGSAITERGVVYSFVSTEPTIGDDKISADTVGTGAFSVILTGLTPGVKYHVRAYATNGAGTAYGEQREVTTQSPGAPSVITDKVTLITDTGATVSGDVTSDGGSSISERGVVYSSTSTEPSFQDDKISATTADTGIFQVALTGLSANAKYYVRAYATNSIETNYGETIFFFTLTPPAPHISVAPASHDFGMKEINSQFVNRKFTVTNTGTTDLIISAISITGVDAEEFTILNDSCSDNTILPTKNCTFEVAFQPISAGLKEAIFSISSNDPDSPVLNVPLQGMRFLKGDVNGDGIIDMKDTVLVLQIMAGITPDSEIQIKADVNGDSNIWLAEVVYILQYVAGLR